MYKARFTALYCGTSEKQLFTEHFNGNSQLKKKKKKGRNNAMLTHACNCIFPLTKTTMQHKMSQENSLYVLNKQNILGLA